MDHAINSYIKADDNKIINEKLITWVKKMGDCLEVCSKSKGCQVGKDTHKICKFHTPESYDKLNVLFE